MVQKKGERMMLVPQMGVIKDPRKMPRFVNHPDRKEPDSRVDEKYVVIGLNGATVRAGEDLSSEKVDMVAKGDTVLVIEQSEDGARVKIDDPEGWVSAKVLAPFSVKQVREGWKGDIEQIDPDGFEHSALEPEAFEDPHAFTMETMKADMRERYEAEGVDFS